MLHITCHGLEDNPCSTDGCEEGPWNGVERVEKATIDDPGNRIDGDGNHSRLYKR